MQRVEAEIAVSVCDFKKNPSAIIDGANGSVVAILNHNRRHSLYGAGQDL